MSNETDKMSIAKELMRETEGATISIAYNSWSARGRGVTASGTMYLDLENVGGDRWRVVDWSARSRSATGHSCGMFSDESECFEAEYKKAEGKELSISEEALNECSNYKGREAIRKAIAFMDEHKVSTMHIDVIDEKMAVLYPEHKGIDKDSSDSVFYKEGYSGIILPNANLIDTSEWKKLNGETDVKLADVHFPKELGVKELRTYMYTQQDADVISKLKPTSVLISMHQETFDLPKHLEAKRVRFFDDVNDKKISSDWDVNELAIVRCKNIIIDGGELDNVLLYDCNNVIVSKDAKIKNLRLEGGKNIVIPTSVQSIQGVDTAAFYVYDKNVKDKVLVDYHSEDLAKFLVRRRKYDIEHDADKKEILDNHKDMQKLLQTPDHESEEYEGKSLKDLYKEAKKTSGVVKADKLAMAEIALNFGYRGRR